VRFLTLVMSLNAAVKVPFPCSAAPAALALASLSFMAIFLKSSKFSQISGLASLWSSLSGILLSATPPCSVPFGNSVTYLSGTPLISFMALAAAAASKGFTPLTIWPPSFAAGATVFFIRSRRSFTAATKSSSAEIAAVAQNAMPTLAQTIIISCFCITPLHSSPGPLSGTAPTKSDSQNVTAPPVLPPWRKTGRGARNGDGI
jgi:hypothetical protein